jgi:hypothetical protein
MSDSVPVEFSGSVEAILPEGLRDVARAELRQVFARPCPEAVFVSHCYGGYAGASRDRMILGVEVRHASGRRTHIVKLGSAEQVGSDMAGWQRCTEGREVASRIFVTPHRRDLPGDRMAVIYPDAYALFGPDREQSRPEPLEEIARRAVRGEAIDPLSVERALAHIYNDLGRWFYPGAVPDPGRALAFYRARLRSALGHWVGADAGTDLGPALVRHAELLRNALGGETACDPRDFGLDRRRQELRRDAVWLLCGGDAPDDPGDAAYLDPYEYVTWALVHGLLPPTLVGRSHGDLHGRNVLVGVQRGEADYPAVFDYGEMGPDNVLAWDFAKMETELKVRLLPEACDDEAREELLAGRLRRDRPAAPATEARAEWARRAERLECAYAFEARLADLTAQIESGPDAALLRPTEGRPAGFRSARLDRLLALLLRVRREAALWLGFERRRPDEWRDEYHFALAVYGLATAKWKYEPRQGECALVSAGVAVARMGRARDAIRRAVAGCGGAEDDYPSHRVPLAIAYRLWQAGRHEEARALLAAVMPLYEHAVPLRQVYALPLAELGLVREAEQTLAPLRELCRVFGDHETLSRIGRLCKMRGDAVWNSAKVPSAGLPPLARWLYRQARAAYGEAFALRRHYYPGANAATLALLLGDAEEAGRLAGDVIAACAGLGSDVPRNERFWVLLSWGEALLIQGEGEGAAGFYESVLADLDPGQVQIAQSAYDQLCRLWHVLGGDAVSPVLKVFARSPHWAALRRGPVGDCGGDRPAPAPPATEP